MTRSGRLLAASTILTVGTVLLQIAYPLTADDQLGRLSVATVVVACAACVTHALSVIGPRATAALVVLVLVFAFAVEALGVTTGFPFGTYAYAHSLGPLLAGVPLLVPLAWLMMTYPCLLMAHELATRTVGRQRLWPLLAVTAGVGGLGLGGWDVFLDPQMVAAGHWTWRHPTPALPGVHGVPLTNLAGWLASGVVLSGLAAVTLRRLRADPTTATRLEVATPTVLLGWTWLGGIVGNAAFFGRPAVAAWGGVLLGCVVVPYLLRVPSRWQT